MAKRLNQRLQASEKLLQTIQEKLVTVMKLAPHDNDRDIMKMAENPYVFVPEDLDLFIAQFKQLLVTKLKYDDLMEERNYILQHLGMKIEENTR